MAPSRPVTRSRACGAPPLIDARVSEQDERAFSSSSCHPTFNGRRRGVGPFALNTQHGRNVLRSATDARVWSHGGETSAGLLTARSTEQRDARDRRSPLRESAAQASCQACACRQGRGVTPRIQDAQRGAPAHSIIATVVTKPAARRAHAEGGWWHVARPARGGRPIDDGRAPEPRCVAVKHTVTRTCCAMGRVDTDVPPIRSTSLCKSRAQSVTRIAGRRA